MFNIPTNSLYMMAFIMTLLMIGSVIQYALQRFNPTKDFTELKQRTHSWWVMILIFLGVLVSGKTASLCFFAFLSFLALKEFFSIVPTRHADRRVLFWAYMSIPLQYYAIASHWYGMFIVFIPVFVFLFLPMRSIFTGEIKGFIQSSGIIHWGIMLTVFCISHIAYFFELPEKNTSAGNIGLVLFLVFMTQFNDICQYVFGKMLGRHKIIPKVSPNKTWEGFLGGFFTAMIASLFLAPLLTPLSSGQGVLAGAIIAFSGFIGDVVISAVKRDLQIKDSSQLIPGHGGVLDRVDSLMYTAPLFFHFVYYLCY